ncbi:DGQHR domain-containing protein [Chryseobacterium sp. Ch-15]|uniref:DGQHR domain-containing protein n=1 Tax=Chryseobacterium muglaense TaxID=2893752 RepID=A0A9Q3UXB9_9FLAO|nr:DGQHR domain-containing protein [Chryseobacterium muglaense]MBD3903241.1 DGQHR domain-containing protein [Chryseobacterium muglaense]MCC9036072.1 DGQHR domain-containing protein [Chryseobacterium muglaense]MCM2553352.1 DGQHR domain-containing protein [Chryseobacterium muglaense]
MRTLELDIIKVHQSIGEIFIASIKPTDLLQMSFVDRVRIEEGDEILGIQRELRKDKVNQIKTYLTSLDATFPNSIIVNVDSKYIKNMYNNKIELEVNENTFTIIDGQHRLEGFRDNYIYNFNLIVSIFQDLKVSQQANIFSTINSQQTKVDPSLNLNLELKSEVYTPVKMMIEIAQSFNYDNESPWFNNIKMLNGKTNGIISIAGFVKPLLEFTSPSKDYYLIRNKLLENKEKFPSFIDFNYDSDKYIFWDFYSKKDFRSTYKILFNYFKSISIILNDDWLNSNSILNKTTGYNAIIRLFKELFLIGKKEGKLTYDFFFEKLSPLSKFNGKINSDNYGASGLKASIDLFTEFKKNIK